LDKNGQLIAEESVKFFDIHWHYHNAFAVGLKERMPRITGSVLFGFGLYWVFDFFHLNELLGSLLVDLAHQLSFYLDSPVL